LLATGQCQDRQLRCTVSRTQEQRYSGGQHDGGAGRVRTVPPAVRVHVGQAGAVAPVHRRGDGLGRIPSGPRTDRIAYGRILDDRAEQQLR